MKEQHARRGASLGPALAVIVLVLTVLALTAGPADAGSRKVVNGSTEFSVPGSQVTALTAKQIALIPIDPVSFRFEWTGVVGWWYGDPMGPGGTFDLAAHKGTLVHLGGLRFVNVADGRSLHLDALRLIVRGSSVTVNASVGEPPATRADVMVATNSPKYTRQAKHMTIDGIQFSLTQQTVIAVQEALGVTLDTTSLFATADVQFRVK